jgi:hypothetical protein
MTRSPSSDEKRTNEEKRVGKSRKPVSPHLAWQVPRHSPNEAPIRKGQLGQNVRQQEKAARKGR